MKCINCPQYSEGFCDYHGITVRPDKVTRCFDDEGEVEDE